MNTYLTNSLNGFASSVNSLIPVSSILIVISIAIGTGFGIYILVWGAKKTVRSVVRGLNGHLSIDSDELNKRSYRAGYINFYKDKYGYVHYRPQEEYKFEDELHYEGEKDGDFTFHDGFWHDKNGTPIDDLYDVDDDDDYERYEITHPHLTQYDIDEIKKDYPDGYDDLPF